MAARSPAKTRQPLELCVATFPSRWNIRWVLDYWKRRWPLLLEHFGSIKEGNGGVADVLALQEVNIGSTRAGQDALLGKIFTEHNVISAAGLREFLQHGLPFPFNSICAGIAKIPGLGLLMDGVAWCCGQYFEQIFGRHTMWIYYTPVVYVLTGCAFVIGNSTLISKRFRTTGRETTPLGNEKVALRVVIETKTGLRISVTNVHAAPGRKNSELRRKQALTIIKWLESHKEDDAQIVLGDFNSTPKEPLYKEFKRVGFRSACCESLGKEPEVTFHQRHESPSKDIGKENCFDYIFYRGKYIQLKNNSVAVLGTNPASKDEPKLYPSDHFGLRATFYCVHSEESA